MKHMLHRRLYFFKTISRTLLRNFMNELVKLPLNNLKIKFFFASYYYLRQKCAVIPPKVRKRYDVTNSVFLVTTFVDQIRITVKQYELIETSY